MSFVKYKISEIAKVNAGGDRPAVFSEVKTPEIGVPIFSNGLENDGLYGYTDKAKIEGDSVTVSARGVNVGTVCYRAEAFTPIVRLLSLVPERSIVDAKYLYYNLKNTHISGVGSAQPQITVPMISNLSVTIHSDLEEQKTIAKALSSYDDLIENNNRLIDKLLEMIDCHFKSWFITYEHFSDSLVEGPLGLQPSNWKVVNLADVTENIRRKVGKEGEETKVFSAVNSGKLTFSEEYFSKQVFSKDISKYIVVEENDFAYNPARVNIGSIGINDLGVNGCVSPVYVVFRVTEGYENFFNCFIKSTRFRKEVIARASGSVRQSMNYDDFGKIEVVYPPQNIVEQFNELVLPLQEMIKEKNRENERLAALRDRLIPEIMSGKVMA